MRVRGIAPEDINLILDNGDPIRRPGQATEIFVSRERVNALIEHHRNVVASLEKLRGKAILLAQDGTIITTYRKN